MECGAFPGGTPGLLFLRVLRGHRRLSSQSQATRVPSVASPERFRQISDSRSEEHTSELQSQSNLVCRLLLEKKKKTRTTPPATRAVAQERPQSHHRACPHPRPA